MINNLSINKTNKNESKGFDFHEYCLNVIKTK